MTDNAKKCNDCGAVLNGDNSYKSKSNVTRLNKEGYSSYCRECHRARAKINRKKIDKVCPLCECSFVGSTGRKYCHECGEKNAAAAKVRKGPEQRNVNKATVKFVIVYDPGPGGFAPGAEFGLDDMRHMIADECLNNGTEFVVPKGASDWPRGKYRVVDGTPIHITGNPAMPPRQQPAARAAKIVLVRGLVQHAHAPTLKGVTF